MAEYKCPIKNRVAGRFYAIRRRCNRPKDKDYKTYGARGIKCEFANFQEFYQHTIQCMEEKGFDSTDPKEFMEFLDSHSIDRINGNGNYSVENTRFIEKYYNDVLQTQSVWHVRLTDELWCPTFLLTQILGLSQKRLPRKIKKNGSNETYRVCWGGFTGKNYKQLPLFWYQLDEPPLLIKDDWIECKCGERHPLKIRYRGKAKCPYIRRPSMGGAIKKVVDFDELRGCEAWIAGLTQDKA